MEEPPELVYALNVSSWKTLPGAGGYDEQEAGRIALVGTLSSVYYAFQGLHNAERAVDFSRANPEAMRVVAFVRKLEANPDP